MFDSNSFVESYQLRHCDAITVVRNIRLKLIQENTLDI